MNIHKLILLKNYLDPILRRIGDFTPFVIFLISFLFISFLQEHSRPYSHRGIYFQKWSSDAMMQTLPIRQLRKTPLQSLWYLHKQPPMLDSIRAAVAQLYKDVGPRRLSVRVDRMLYVIGSILFATMSSLVYVWIRSTTSKVFAVAMSIVWTFHPAALFFATFLEGTFLSSLATTWFLYEFWRVKIPDGSITRLSIAAVFAYYTRTLFQWYFFPIVICALMLRKMHFRQLVASSAIIFVLVFPYILKQYILFSTTSTTTFAGVHKLGIIWYEPSDKEYQAVSAGITKMYPEKAVLYSGNDQYNTYTLYVDNLVNNEIFERQIKSNPKRAMRNIAKSFLMNFKDYMRPSSRYTSTDHAIVDRLPWRKHYDFVFSGLPLAFGLLFFTGKWLVSFVNRKIICAQFIEITGRIMPIGYIFLITTLSNRYDWTEAVRLKFFLEPVFFIFVASQIYILFIQVTSFIHRFGEDFRCPLL